VYQNCFNTNLVFKCRIHKLSLSKVCKGEKLLHSLPRVAIALAEAQLWYYFLTNRNRVKNDLYAAIESYFGITTKRTLLSYEEGGVPPPKP
jgi:hypothetical protein